MGILNKYVPIKQKVLFRPGSEATYLQTKKTSDDETRKETNEAEVNKERGLRLVNINNLLSDPCNKFTDSSNEQTEMQDQPLDLSRKSTECNNPTQATQLPLDLTLKSDSIAAPPQQQPIQFLLLDKSIIKLVPISHSSSNVNNPNSVNDEKPRKQNALNKKSVSRKSTESMVKTNETITKNGSLFCTFKNVKHMNLLREQQAKKSSRKKEKNK